MGIKRVTFLMMNTISGRSIHLRKATSSDLDKVLEFNSLLFKEDGGTRDRYVDINWPEKEGPKYFKKMVTGGKGIIFIAEVDGTAAGYLAGYLKHLESWRPVVSSELDSMYVRKQLRSKGIGAALVNEFLRWSKKKGASTVKVTAFAKNSRAVSFYEGKGFAPLNLSLELQLD